MLSQHDLLSLENLKKFFPINLENIKTLVNNERYFTSELKDYEDKILSASDKIVGAIQQEAKLKESGQTTMFDLFGDAVQTPMLEISVGHEDASDREKAAWESELLGINLTGGLASLVGNLNGIEAIVTVEDFNKRQAGQRVKIVGQVFSARSLLTKDKRAFAIVELELLDGKVTIFIWPEVYNHTRHLWFEGSLVFVVGKTNSREGQMVITCHSAEEYLVQHTDVSVVGVGTDAGRILATKVTGENTMMTNDQIEPEIGNTLNAGESPPAPVPSSHKTVVITVKETDQPTEDEHQLKELLQLLLEHPDHKLLGSDFVSSFMNSRSLLL